MYAKLFLYIFVINSLILIFAAVGDDEKWLKAENKTMLPYELQDVYDFEDGAVIVRGYEKRIEYVVPKDEPIKFQICREKAENCKYNFGENKTLRFCYFSEEREIQQCHPCERGPEFSGFLIRDTPISPDKTKIFVGAPYVTDGVSYSIPFGQCIGTEIVREIVRESRIIYWLKFIGGPNDYELNGMEDYEFSSFQGDTNLRRIRLYITSNNKVCGYYFKFLNGFFPIYNWVDAPLPPPPPTTTTTTTTTLPTTFTPLSTTKETTIILTVTDKPAVVAESFMLQWILIGVGALIIVLLIVASIFCCVRHKFTKPRRSKKSLTDKKVPEQLQVSLPASSEGAQYNPSSEAYQKPTIIDFRKKQHELQKHKKSTIKKESNIRSLQTAVPPPTGLRGFRNTDELYRLALTAETREERNVYLDSSIENANEEIQIWQSSHLSQTNDTSMLPAIAKRIINAKKAGVKLISTKDPTKLIPEQMDGLTYEQINDLALIEHYSNVRYALFERAAELIKRAFEDSAPDAHFDKDNIEPLLYQYQLGVYEINEEPHKDVEKRTKLLDEILKKKEMKENDK